MKLFEVHHMSGFEKRVGMDFFSQKKYIFNDLYFHMTANFKPFGINMNSGGSA